MKTRKDILRPIRKLVRNQCANFHGRGQCHQCPEDQGTCNFFREDGQHPEHQKKGLVKCNYFERNVLPADPAIELAYWGKHPDSLNGRVVRKCIRCGTSFTKRSNRHQFCSKCKDEQIKNANRERQRQKYWSDKGRNLTI